MTKPVKAAQKAVAESPGETTSLSVAVVVGAVLGLFNIELQPGQVAALVVLVSAIPAGVKLLVAWRRKR
jgi:hypothetical protein